MGGSPQEKKNLNCTIRLAFYLGVVCVCPRCPTFGTRDGGLIVTKSEASLAKTNIRS